MTKREIIDKICILEQLINNIDLNEMNNDNRKKYFDYRRQISSLMRELKFIDGPTYVGEEIDLYLNEDKSKNDNYYIITLHNTKEEIGELRVSLNEDDIYLGNIGYYINPFYRGHNYTLKSLNLIRKSLIEMGKKSLIITTYPENIASKKIIENFGGKIQENSLDWDVYNVDLNNNSKSK